MKLELVTDLLTLITEYDRQAFPPGAHLAWHDVLDGIDYGDARQAIIDHYGSASSRDGSGNVRKIMPADVRTGARKIREHRERMARRALPAGRGPRVGSTGRPPAVMAEVSAARARAAEAVAKYRQKVAAA